jgi:hypothetical protein
MSWPSRFKWIGTAGGPPIMLAASLLTVWEGSNFPSNGRVVEAHFRYFSENDPATDYDRACDVDGYIGQVPVGSGTGIVFADETTTVSWHPGEGRNAANTIVKMMWIHNDALVEAALSASEQLAWEDNFEYDSDSADHVIFDSACPGSDTEESLHVRLAHGRFIVQTAVYERNPDVYLVLHRFVPQQCPFKPPESRHVSR